MAAGAGFDRRAPWRTHARSALASCIGRLSVPRRAPWPSTQHPAAHSSTCSTRTGAGHHQRVQDLQRLGPRLGVAVGNLGWVQPVAQQPLRVAQQLARKRQHLRATAAAGLRRWAGQHGGQAGERGAVGARAPRPPPAAEAAPCAAGPQHRAARQPPESSATTAAAALPPGHQPHHVGAVADLLLLRLRRQDQQLGGRVLHLQLGGDRGRVAGDKQLLQVVDHHLVHACGSGSGRPVGECCTREQSAGQGRARCRRRFRRRRFRRRRRRRREAAGAGAPPASSTHRWGPWTCA